MNEASKQIFANDLFKMSCKYTQGIFSKWKICFNVINIRTYDELLSNLSKIFETVKQTTCNNFTVDVNKLQKQFQSVIQIHLDQSANFGSLILLVCVTVSYNVAFNSINR